MPPAPSPRNLQIRSSLDADGTLEVTLADAGVTPPEDDQLVVQIEAAPINPSDLIPLLAGADPAEARFEGSGESARITARLSPAAARANASRVGRPLGVGLEGAGLVVEAGRNAQALIGKRVGMFAVGSGLYSEYVTVAAKDCVPLPEGVSSREGAGLFCNPLTALAMVETLYQTGRKAMVHTAAASNLGQMLVKICQQDGIPLVNIVRRQDQAELLRAIGAEHVCDSSAPGFADALHAALVETGATVAFDAIGGGTMAGDLVAAMEKAATARLGTYSPYGSPDHKQVYIYGGLDPSPTILPRRAYGMMWDVGGWAMPPILEKAGPARKQELVQRILDGLATTFASHFAQELSLSEALRRETLLDYCRLTTGRKFLINPTLQD